MRTERQRIIEALDHLRGCDDVPLMPAFVARLLAAIRKWRVWQWRKQ
jgi:hypothetical protein